MKKIFSFLLFVALLVCGACADDGEPQHTHEFGEWYVEKEPTLEEEGERARKCVDCEHIETERIAKLVAVYTITADLGNGTTVEIPVAENGVYDLADPEKAGYLFEGWETQDGEAFAKSGTITESCTIVAVWKLKETTTFAELKAHIEGGADRVHLTANITLTETIYVTGNTLLYTGGNYTLTRSDSFLGDLFVLGRDADGNNKLFDGVNAGLTLHPTGEGSITIDGNKANITGDVTGTAFFVENSSTLSIYDGVTIQNCKKTANAYLLENTQEISDPEKVGGAAVIIINGVLDMYGGTIQNCEATLTDGGTSFRGGAIFNYCTFNMYGGTIQNCDAGRGGAIYNYRFMYLTAGTIQNNHSASYGGAYYQPDTQYAYSVLGEEGQTLNLQISENQADKSGGAIYTSQQSTVYIRGNTLFFKNKAGSNGGAINAAGALVTDWAKFEQNTAGSKGGAIYAYYSSPDNSTRFVELKGGLFVQNTAYRGGAVAFGAGDEVTSGAIGKIGAVTFQNNSAPKNTGASSEYGFGGAIHVDSGSDVTILGSATFTSNTAGDNGGAIYVTKAASRFTIDAGANVTVTFQNNTATGNGGAVYISAATVNLNAHDGGKLLVNGCQGDNGGAFAVHSSGTLNLNGGTTAQSGIVLQGNNALGYGGALYVNASAANIAGMTSFVQNISGDNGGAIYITKAATTLSIEAEGATVTFDGNQATGNGGAIYISAATATMEGGKVLFEGNEATGNGGAIAVYSSGHAKISAATFQNNKATGNGGAAYLSGKSETTIESFEGTGNTASQGGAFYITTGSTKLTLLGGSLSGNTATATDGGNGLYANKSTVTVIFKGGATGAYVTYEDGDIASAEGLTISDIPTE